MEQEPKKNSTENGNSSSGFLWFALIIAGTLGLGAFLMSQQMGHKLAYSDFARLVKATKFEDSESQFLAEGFNGEIIVKSSSAKNKFERISNLSDLKIGTRRITATVNVSKSDDALQEDTNQMAWSEPKKSSLTVSREPNDDILFELSQDLNSRFILSLIHI